MFVLFLSLQLAFGDGSATNPSPKHGIGDGFVADPSPNVSCKSRIKSLETDPR